VAQTASGALAGCSKHEWMLLLRRPPRRADAGDVWGVGSATHVWPSAVNVARRPLSGSIVVRPFSAARCTSPDAVACCASTAASARRATSAQTSGMAGRGRLRPLSPSRSRRRRPRAQLAAPAWDFVKRHTIFRYSEACLLVTAAAPCRALGRRAPRSAAAEAAQCETGRCSHHACSAPTACCCRTTGSMHWQCLCCSGDGAYLAAATPTRCAFLFSPRLQGPCHCNSGGAQAMVCIRIEQYIKVI
jgi:hypothetical protein